MEGKTPYLVPQTDLAKKFSTEQWVGAIRLLETRNLVEPSFFAPAVQRFESSEISALCVLSAPFLSNLSRIKD